MLDLCERAIKLISPRASGVFNLDLKQDVNHRARITEVNAGKFAMITNLYDLTGRHNLAQTYVRLALGQVPRIAELRDFAADSLSRPRLRHPPSDRLSGGDRSRRTSSNRLDRRYQRKSARMGHDLRTCRQ